MTTLDLPSLPQFAGVEVTLGGHATARSFYDWSGEMRADASVVAVAFLVAPGGVCWCKSERARGWGLSVGLSLRWYDDLGHDVQVNWSIGGGQRRSRTTLDAPATPAFPLVPECVTFETGAIQSIFTVPGEPLVTCAALLLPAEVVRVGRNGLWQLRRRERERVPQPLRRMLSYGRTGTLRP